MEGGTRKRTTAFHVSVAVLMVVTGTLNTLTMKWADESSAKGQKGVHVPKKCSSLFGPVECRDYSSDQAYVHQFDHPYIQTLFMFIGEMTCFVAFKIFAAIRSSQGKSVNKGQKFNPLIFLPPALCDMFGSSIMILGLTMTTASSFQMLRGSVIIFTGLLSVAFLRNRLRLHHWLGILVVIIGLVVIGVSQQAGSIPATVWRPPYNHGSDCHGYTGHLRRAFPQEIRRSSSGCCRLGRNLRIHDVGLVDVSLLFCPG
eukprot:m.31296 g.31296  ORF g.31296 m.31296 type:complete len:257 (+) comp31478_c0_seq2:19-789(+)